MTRCDGSKRIARLGFDLDHQNSPAGSVAEYEQNVFHHDRQIKARWMVDYSQQRAQMAIYDLVNFENVRAREITRAVDANDTNEVTRIVEKDGAFSALNRLLRLANLDVSVSAEANDEIMAIRNGSQLYHRQIVRRRTKRNPHCHQRVDGASGNTSPHR
jgi:hypothetical protein